VAADYAVFRRAYATARAFLLRNVAMTFDAYAAREAVARDYSRVI
jgi:hypothetical protein